MSKLLQITKDKELQQIHELPFRDEVNDLESFIKEYPDIIGKETQIFGEQVDTGVGDRIDLLALIKTDETNQIALIELKAGLANQQVLLQTLRYAKWITNHPDSIRLLLEKKRISTEKLEFVPKIIILASEIEPELIEFSQYNQVFEFDFIQLKRYGTKERCYLFIEHKTIKQEPITRVRSYSEWSWERYENELHIGKDTIQICKINFEKIISIISEKRWNLTPKFNKNCISFKNGAKNVIIIWLNDHSLGFKLGQPPSKLRLKDPYPDSRGKFWTNSGEYYAVIELDTNIIDYLPFIEEAYSKVVKE